MYAVCKLSSVHAGPYNRVLDIMVSYVSERMGKIMMMADLWSSTVLPAAEEQCGGEWGEHDGYLHTGSALGL